MRFKNSDIFKALVGQLNANKRKSEALQSVNLLWKNVRSPSVSFHFDMFPIPSFVSFLPFFLLCFLSFSFCPSVHLVLPSCCVHSFLQFSDPWVLPHLSSWIHWLYYTPHSYLFIYAFRALPISLPASSPSSFVVLFLFRLFTCSPILLSQRTYCVTFTVALTPFVCSSGFAPFPHVSVLTGDSFALTNKRSRK
jgi:hypothetical protein